MTHVLVRRQLTAAVFAPTVTVLHITACADVPSCVQQRVTIQRPCKKDKKVTDSVTVLEELPFTFLCIPVVSVFQRRP